MDRVSDALRLIKTQQQYDAALAEYESYFDREPKSGTVEADRFELLGMLLDRYESERFPIPDADPIQVVKLVMEARGFSQSDLGRLFGSSSRASEVLNGKRSLSVEQIRRLHREWSIPADILIGERGRSAAA